MIIRRLASLALAGVLAFAALAHAQGGATSTISGVVVDSAGGFVPGVTVVVKNLGTGNTFETVTNREGQYSVPALPAGVYSVTVALQGFKTAVVNDVRLQPGIPATANVTLEIGTLEEVVNVRSSSELVNTQTATVSSTLNVDQINVMPLPTRNALNAVAFLVGVNTTGVNRDATVNGLPQSFINITLDGVSNNDNFNKSTDGFFAMVTPRQDAVEAVTTTTAAGGADVGGHGAASVNFVTRSGSNKFSGSAYEYFRHPDLNSNTWFNHRNNLPKNDIRLNQFGARQGGPIVIPGLYNGRGKAFFFANYEELRLPNNYSRTRSVLHPRAIEGIFRYEVGTTVREVDVLALASRFNQVATRDPLVMQVLGNITSSMTKTGTINATSNPLVNDYVWQSPGEQWERQPVVRIDYNISDRHRLSATNNQVWVTRDPDQLNAYDSRFPGAPNYAKYTSMRPSRSVTLRSTLTNNLVSEVRAGTTRGGYSYFGQMETNGPQSYADQGGFAITLDGNDSIGLTSWWVRNAPTWRTAYSYNVDTNLSWHKGKHSVTGGGALFFSRVEDSGQQMVPGISLGFNTTQDPAASMFTSANFPDASSGQLTDARALYALLTGRVLSVSGQASLDANTGKYVAFGPRTRGGKMDEYSAFLQDSWRATPTLTINAGVRWDVQMPFTPVNDVMSTVTMADVCGMSGLGAGGVYGTCNFNSPGATGGKVPEFSKFQKGKVGYNTDWNNVAPNVSMAWRPNAQTGWLRTLLGDPDQATLRAGVSVAYERQGLAEFTTTLGANPGSQLSLTRNVSTGIVGPGETWPVFLREPERLYTAPFPESPVYPIAIRPNRADDIYAFHPDIKIASARTWTVGLQRALSTDMAMELRYVGTRGVDQWSTLNYNSIRGESLVNNGFIDEFRLAMANLQANNASGASNRRGSFAYFGAGTGTNPLPTYLAYLNGRKDFTNPAAYTGGSNTWTSTTLAARMVATNPSPINSAADLDGTLARRQNAAAAGLAANFFLPNPDIDDVNVTDSGAFSDFHALQLELRRRLSRGLQVNGSYQYSHEGGSSFHGFQFGRVMIPSSGVRHAIKTQWEWEIPVGRGRRFGSGMNGVLNGVLGGWRFNGVGRIQARMVNFGNVRLVGMTKDELQDMYKFDIRIDPATGLRTVYMLPDDVILNTRRAFSVSTTTLDGYSTSLGAPEGRYIAPANTATCLQIRPGECSPQTLMIRAPWFSRFDIGVTKRFPIKGSVNFELRADILNVFDNVNFNPVADPGTGAAIFQSGSAYSDLSNTFDPGGRLGMLVFRLNW